MYEPKPFETGYLPEQDGHKVYYACFGNETGIPIVHLHGGPGDKSKARHAAAFDLDTYQIITFDQRGSGQSEPPGKTENNTTQKLAEDIERLRQELNIESWFVAGGSWGSTLALLYAEAYPEAVRGLLLTKIFLARSVEGNWALWQEGGVQRLYPDAWEERLQFLRQYGANPKNAAPVLLKKLQNADEQTQKEIAAGVFNWESNLMSIRKNVSYLTAEDIDEAGIMGAKIFLHYEANNFFLKENQLLDNVNAIAHLPTIIVHGRFDVLAPLKQVWELRKYLNQCEVVVLPTSAHSFSADGNVAQKLAFEKFLQNNT